MQSAQPLKSPPSVSDANVDAPPLPRYVQIEPVGQCNLRCRMCAIQFRKDGPPHGPLAFMPVHEFRRIVEGFPALDHLHLQGLGEPMMHPQFFEMIEWAAARGVRVSTNSNLTLVSQRRARLCVDSGLAELHVSLDAASAPIYERIRVGARFDKVLRNLRRVLAARQAAGSAMRVRIVMVLMRDNLAELPALVTLAADEGVGEVFVQQLCHDFAEHELPAHYRPMRLFVDGQQIGGVDGGSVEAAFAAARAIATERGVDLRLPRRGPREIVPGRLRCDWPWTGAYVSYRGDSMPCCMVGTPDRASFGNMVREQPAEVWRNAAYQAFRAGLREDRPAAVCRSCAIYRGTF
jgi:MoaA/NifB/PqqE/SkfB family radical SAM enzyme